MEANTIKTNNNPVLLPIDSAVAKKVEIPCCHKKYCIHGCNVCTDKDEKWCTPTLSKKQLANLNEKKSSPDFCCVMGAHEYPEESCKCNIPQIKKMLEDLGYSCHPKLKCITGYLKEDTVLTINKYRNTDGFTETIPDSILNSIWHELITAAKNNM